MRAIEASVERGQDARLLIPGQRRVGVAEQKRRANQ